MTSSTPFLAQTPKLGSANVAAADTTTYKTLYTAGASGSKIMSIQVTSNDSVPHVAVFQVNRSGSNSNIVAATIAGASGTNGLVPTVQVLGNNVLWTGLPIDNDGQQYFFLQSGDILQVQANTTLTAATNWHVFCVGVDF